MIHGCVEKREREREREGEREGERGREREREREGEREGEGHRVVECADVEDARHDVEGTCILWLNPHQISVEKAEGQSQRRGDAMMMCRGDWWVSKVRFLQSAFLIECVSARERKREGC